jgi:hypothetical protein
MRTPLAVRITVVAVICLSPLSAWLQQPVAAKAWVAKSNQYTQLLIDLDEKYSPEYGSSQGLAEYDKKIGVPTLANQLSQRKEEEALVTKLTAALSTETETPVRQDLNLLITSLKRGFRQWDYTLKKEVPFVNATASVYNGLQMLLDDQTPAARRSAAVVRIKEYAGLKGDYKPLTVILQERVEQQIAAGPDMIYPSKQSIGAELSHNPGIVAGIAELCKKYKLTGWTAAYAQLKKQLEDYDKWLRDHVLSKGRIDFRLPPEEYALALESFGIDISPADLARMAHAAFTDIQEQMKPIAVQIAQQRHLPSSDYRDVVRELKKEQIHGDSIILLYEQHLKDIEQIIRDHQLVTLPGRPAMIRLATAAETAQAPEPHMVPPAFLNNTGQHGVFVLPLNMPPAPGGKTDKFDDFTFEAASWTVIAHEARPGHELQFDKMVEEGVSSARALYAFNSTNIEGWGLYSEYIVRPYMPLEGQLVSLDYRLLRAARAFLDPGLQAGTITPGQALDLLMKDVCQSHAFAQEEVERYTLQMPGQANSYFYGFVKMIALRKDAEQALGANFNALRFHDFILSQGPLTPALIREAVMKDFVPAELK